MLVSSDIYIYILTIFLCLLGIGSLKSYAYNGLAFIYPNGGNWNGQTGPIWAYYSYEEESSNSGTNNAYLPSAPTRDGYAFLGYISFDGYIASTENFANALYNYRRGLPITPYSETVWYTDGVGVTRSIEVTVDTKGNITLKASHYSKTTIGTILKTLRYPGQGLAQDYYAVWEKAPGFNIKFDVNGGSISISNQIVNDITLPNPGTRAGYTFDGWYNGDTRIGGIGDKWKPTANATLTAKWTPIIYTIRYNTYEGKLSKEKTVTYTVESPTITLENPTLDGKEFLGWSDWNDSTPKKPYTIPKGTVGDLIISANWGADTSGYGDYMFTGQSHVKSNKFKIAV